MATQESAAGSEHPAGGIRARRAEAKLTNRRRFQQGRFEQREPLMTVSQRLLWNIYAGAVGALTAVVAQKAVRGAWKVATGDEPPDPNDPATPLSEAVIWALAGGIGIGIAQLLTNRFAAAHWERAMGSPAPTRPPVSFKF